MMFLASLPAHEGKVDSYEVHQSLSLEHEEQVTGLLSPSCLTRCSLTVSALVTAFFYGLGPELVLKFNDLQPTASVTALDQLFPLLLGAASLAHAALAPRELPPHLEKLMVAAAEKEAMGESGLVGWLWSCVYWRGMYACICCAAVLARMSDQQNQPF